MLLTPEMAGEMKLSAPSFMSDEIPPAPSETADDASKAETIRITLPSKPDQPTAKRETVRINLPGKPAVAAPPGLGPKKETTKIPAPDEMTTQISPPPPTASKPFMPPPPKPPGGLSTGMLKPVSGVNPPPKPPSLGARPTVPLKPAPAPTTVARPVAPAGSGLNPPPEPVTQRASPKKETARITLPPEGGKAAMPKATIKMQQTQPLVKQPGATISQSSIQPAPTLTTTSMTAVPAEAVSDSLVTLLSIVALVASAVALGLVYWVYSASALS
jgi:hypothetical protein